MSVIDKLQQDNADRALKLGKARELGAHLSGHERTRKSVESGAVLSAEATRKAADKVVKALGNVKVAVETPETDLAPVVEAVNALVPHLKQDLKFPKIPDSVKVSNLGELQVVLEDILLSLKTEDAREPQTVTVTAPEVHVEAPDLTPLQSDLQDIRAAIDNQPTVEIPATDLGVVVEGLAELKTTIEDIRFPVPNFIVDPLIKYRIADEDSAGTTKYYGFVATTGAWYIMKNDSTAGTYRYINGSSSYSTNFTNRASLTYGYINTLTNL